MPLPSLRPYRAVQAAIAAAAGLAGQRTWRIASLAALLAPLSLAAAPVHADPGREPALVVALDHLPSERSVADKHRTPDSIDHALALDLARRLQRPLLALANDAASTHGDQGGMPALRLTTLVHPVIVPAGQVAIPVRYDAAPMAIMRTDTTIKRWEDLKGRTVCVARDGKHAGSLAAGFGAQEKVYPSSADALVALRIGACDASVHDTALLQALIRFPEWKKFSAQLPARESRALAFLVPATDTRTIAALRKATQAWRSERLPAHLAKEAARNIAFEVYLEQDVPDCH
ncbi:MAG TPA: transporter substrate-binding domain-containing protein [Noviherbaspirillum sp.]